MKKKIMMLLALTMLTSHVAYASEADSSETKDISGEITFYTWAQNEESGYPYTVVEAFEEKYPGVTVNVEVGSNSVEEYLQVQNIKLLSGEGIDVTAIRAESRQDYVDAGYLVNLDGQPFLDNYKQAHKDLIAVDGSVYSIPYSLDMMGVVYNIEMFEENGWSVPTNWEEFIALLDEVKSAGYTLMNGGKDAWPMEMDIYPILHDVIAKDPQIFEKVDAGEVKYTDEVFVNAFKKIDEFYKAGYVGKETLGLNCDQAAAYFVQGKTPLMIHGSWVTMYFDEIPFEYGVFPIPHNSAGEEQVAATTIGISVAVTTCSQNPDAAMAFVEYLSSVEGGTYLSKGMGNICPVIGVEKEGAEEWLKLLELDKSVDFFYSVQYPGANSEMLKGLQMMLLGEATPEEVCENIQIMQDKK